MSTFSKTVSCPFNFHHYLHIVRMMSEEGQCCSTPPFNTTLREKVKSSFYNKDLFSTLEPIQLWNRKTTYKVSNMLKLRSSYQFNWNGSVYNAHVYNSFFYIFICQFKIVSWVLQSSFYSKVLRDSRDIFIIEQICHLPETVIFPIFYH